MLQDERDSVAWWRAQLGIHEHLVYDKNQVSYCYLRTAFRICHLRMLPLQLFSDLHFRAAKHTAEHAELLLLICQAT